MNSHRDPFLFRKYLKRLVHFNQGLVRYSEFLAIDESTPATALRTLSGLMKREFEDDYLELATRMYEAWQVTVREEAIQSLEKIQRKLTLMDKLKSFLRWSEQIADQTGLKIPNPFSAFYEGRQSHRTSPKPRSNVPRVLTPTLLPTASPVPRSTLLRDTTAGTSTPPAFEKLYQDHIRRKDQQSARRKAKAEVDSRHCSFSPSVNSSFVGSRAPVFDRLSADSRSMSAKSLSTMEREVRSCSFAPQLTSKQYFSVGSSAAALHDHSGLVQRKIRQMQLEAERKELAKCSFTPQVRSPGVSRSSSFTTSASSKSVFEKLFEAHGQSQHRLREQALVQAQEETKATPFRPKVNRPTSGTSPAAAERLYADSKARDRKMAKLREHYSAGVRHQGTGSVGGGKDQPAYERLFGMQKGWEGKRNSLTEKLMQEQGVTFAPRLNQK